MEDDRAGSNISEPDNVDESTLVDSNCNSKRSEYLEWPEYFMAISFLSAMRSKDPVTQVGACIVSPDRKIVGIGYNGMPSGCSDDLLPWRKHSQDPLENKYMYVCHAEMNAIMNKNSADVKGCSIYVALFPCNECSKLIIQAGISEVVYASDKHSEKPSTIASKRLLQMAGVECTRYTPRRRRIVIDFDVIDWSQMNQIPDSPPRPTGSIDSFTPPRPVPCSINDIPADIPPRATDSVDSFTPPRASDSGGGFTPPRAKHTVDAPPRATDSVDNFTPPRASGSDGGFTPRATDSVDIFTPPCSVPCAINDIPTDIPPCTNTHSSGDLSGSLPS